MIPVSPDMSAREHLLDFDPAGLKACLDAMGERAFRAGQVLEWVYEHGAGSINDMTNLSKALRERLDERLSLFTSQTVRRAVSRDGTVKLLLRWPDGEMTECVMIPAQQRRTACVSTQVGCPAQCRFCASGIGGLRRNLTAGEMIEQVLRIRAEALDSGQRVTHVVFMGIGEPLINYDAALRAVRTINAPWGLNIGARKITISTVGLPKPIRRLAGEGLQLNLALSLHAPTDGLRAELIPWAEKTPLADLVDACRYYYEMTGREVTLEYLLLHEVNDRRTHAEQLARLAGQLRCNVNLICYNPVAELEYRRPSDADTQAFEQQLRRLGVNAHIRASRGMDIDAACGQLRRKEQSQHEGAP